MFTLEIFLAVFIFILLVLISIDDALTGFLLLLMLIPLQHKELFSLVYWDVLPIRIAFFGLVLTTGYRFYLWYRRKKDYNSIKNFIKDPFLILLFLLYFVRLVSVFFAENKFAGIKLLAFYTLIVYFYILIKSLYIKHGKNFIERALQVYIITGFVTAFFGIIQFFSFKLLDEKFGAIWEIPGHNPRIGSTFWDVNHYGAFVASVIPVSIVFAFFKTGKSRFFYAFNTVFLGLVLYLTQSRSAWLGLFVAFGLLVVLLFLKGFKKYAKYVVLAGISVFAVFLIYAQVTKGGFINYYKQFMHTRLDSFDTHFILLRGAYEAYSTSPFIGGGYGNFNEAFRKTSYAEEYFFREKNIVDKRVPSHSIWGEVITETGFLGLFFYVLLFFTTLSLLIRGFFKTKGYQSFMPLALFTSISALLIAGIFYTYNLEFFWLITFIGMAAAFEYNKGINFNKYIEWLFNIKRLPVIFLSLFTFTLLIWDISKNKLIDWDEAIYAQVSKNIINTGDYITLYWDIGKPWFEKPPLYFWISSLFMQIFGVSEFSARLPSVVFAFLSVLMVYVFAKYIFKSRFVGLISGLMLITTADFWYYGRLSMLDVTVSFFILTSLYFAYRFFEEKKLYLSALSGVFVGFAVLTKAIVGLLPLPIIFIYIVYLILFQKNTNINSVVKGVSVFLASLIIVALPWHLAVYSMHGEQFINVYIKEHILGRGLTDSQGKTRPFFWYLEVLKVSMRGWFLVLIPSFIFAVYKAVKNSKSYVFLVIYSVIIFLFFSVSNSKLLWYIIPIYPSLVIINAAFLYWLLNFVYSKKQKITLNFKKLTGYYTYKNIVGVFTILFSLTLSVYILEVTPKVFYPDFNKDRVKVIQAYNEKYVDTPSTVTKLFYLRMDSPVVKFYVKGDAVSSDVGPFTEYIQNAPFNESQAYISRQGEVVYFQELLSDERVVPSYNAGAYSLMYVRSLEEYYSIKVKELTSEILQKSNKCDLEPIKDECSAEIRQLQQELFNDQQILHNNMPQKYPEPVVIFYE